LDDKLARTMHGSLARAFSVAALIAGAFGLVPATAGAQAERDAAPRRPGEGAATSAVGSAKYKEACAQGNARYVARDFGGAIEMYRKAIELDPKNPLAHYLLGEAQLGAGNLAEADAAWNRAALESAEKDPALRGRVLFVLADLKEREKKWDDAKAAWQVYLDWVAKYPKAGGFAASGQSRQQAIDAMLNQDKAYQIVRQRIADTKAGTVFTDLSKSPPAPSK
jgi:tetratricopeptide (TPR) repeat protein